MKLQRQIGPECTLATLAMLADVPLPEVRAKALEAINRDSETPWTDFGTWLYKRIEAEVRCGGDRQRRAGRVWNTIQEAVWGAFGVQLPERVRMRESSTPPCGSTESQPLTKDLLQGKGSVIVRTPYGRHIVAYEDGVIYDSDCPQGALGFEEWFALRQPVTWEVYPLERVSPEDGNGIAGE